ncbi:hypothetical protein EMIT0111MI5_10598 [Burkholderia sp. IT-111MI5]
MYQRPELPVRTVAVSTQADIVGTSENDREGLRT